MFGRQIDRSIPDAVVREPCLASLRVPEAAGHTVGEIEFVAEDVRFIRDPVVSSSGHLIFRRAFKASLVRSLWIVEKFRHTSESSSSSANDHGLCLSGRL